MSSAYAAALTATVTPIIQTPAPFTRTPPSFTQRSNSGTTKRPTIAGQTGGGGGSSGLSGGQIAGIIIGFILGTVLIGGVVFVVKRRHHAYLLDRVVRFFRSDSTSGIITSGDSNIFGAENPVYFSKNAPEEPGMTEESGGIIMLDRDIEDISES